MPVKISALPQQTAPVVSDKVPVVSGGQTNYELLSDLITLFFNNIPAGAHSDVTRGAETMFDFVASGGVITGDSLGVNRNASMTAVVVYINGRRISVGAVTARTYTASKDTYVDVLDNLDGTGTLVYTEVANNAASPALAANSIRIGIVVTGATTIAAAASINQGQVDRILPIASSIPYSVTDSLGNLICGRDPMRKTLSLRRITANATTLSASYTDLTGLSCPVIVAAGRRIKAAIQAQHYANSGSTINTEVAILEDGTQLGETLTTDPTANFAYFARPEVFSNPTTGSHTYKAQWKNNSAGAQTSTLTASSTSPAYLAVEYA